MNVWPKCPECKRPMWLGQIGAPMRIVHGCSDCDVRINDSGTTAELVLFEEAS